MPWKNRLSVGAMVILLAVVGLVLGSAPGLAKTASEKTTTLISLDVRQMYLQDVLRLIAEKADINIIVEKEVLEANIVITLCLEDVDLWQALESILEVSGFGYREEDGIIRVVKLEAEPPPALERKRFQLNYINVEEKKDVLTKALGNIIKGEGELFLDPLTNSVYVTAISSCLKKVKEYFEVADVRRKRIMIKVEFIEVRLTDEAKLGIKWRWEGAYESYPLGVTFDYPYYASPEPGEKVPEPRAPLSTLAAGIGIIFGSAEQEFRGIIDMLISEGKAHLLSSPNIVTLEGEEAEIDVVDEYPYETYVVEEGVKETVIKFKSVGATLLVTPHIKEEKWIVLDIQPEVSEITGAPPFVGAPPIVGTRKARTQIAVNDGDTIVIGGLLRETETETKSGVPFLSRIPILGSLFSHKTVKKEKTDLLILITPYVLPEKIEEIDVLEQRKPLKVQMEELYQKGLDYKGGGEYEKARQCFEEVLKKSRVYGFTDYLKIAEKKLVTLKGLEEELKNTIKEELLPTSNEIASKKEKGLAILLVVFFLVAALSSN